MHTASSPPFLFHFQGWRWQHNKVHNFEHQGILTSFNTHLKQNEFNPNYAATAIVCLQCHSKVYLVVKGSYILNSAKLLLSARSIMVMHVN